MCSLRLKGESRFLIIGTLLRHHVPQGIVRDDLGRETLICRRILRKQCRIGC